MPAVRPSRKRAATLTGRREKRVDRDRVQRERMENNVGRGTSVAVSNEEHAWTTSAAGSPQRYIDSDPPFDIGTMDKTCRYEWCKAINFAGEAVNDHFSICCNNGKVCLERQFQLTDYPEDMHHLLTAQSPQARNFREHIRNYNSAMAFASLAANVADSSSGRGPYTYKIHGDVYTRVSNVATSANPSYGQLYILDSETALVERMGRKENEKCRADVMSMLDESIRTVSPYAQAYQNLQKLAQTTSEPHLLRLFFLKDATQDQRRYNDPTANEVSVVFSGTDGDPPDNIDFAIFPVEGPMQLISHTSPNSDPMAFPVLFPGGTRGWCPQLEHHPDRRTQQHNRLTMRDFYKFRIAVRPSFNPLHHAGKLFQQYIVMAYVKIESNDLYYIRNNQCKLRVERYQGLMDAMSRDDPNGLAPGRLFILPSTFIGSPRNMQQNYQDAIAHVQRFGKPDLFVTFTCNPKWPEISKHLSGCQTAAGRPDLVARVFHLKLKELLRDISERHLFGNVAAVIHVIEFQKRGLPHAHILIILKSVSKIRGREMIDQFVSAELPDRDRHPVLYERVVSHMIHGPCGRLNLRAPCMENGTCTKSFPKEFRDETLENVDGFPEYRRRQGQTVVKSGAVLDNRFVVPFNAELLRKFDAHINVEICSTVKSVKYIYKYVYKGHDSANVEITSASKSGTDRNEIQMYVDGRCVTPPEAAWRIFGFRMQQQSHSVIRLPVHLPLQHAVVFDPSDISAALERSSTALTRFFDKCGTDPDARQMLYLEFGEAFIFTNGEWVRRKKARNVISRMYVVPPSHGERYFLRLLLLHVRGPTSFQDLRTFDGRVYDSFFEAAKARGLLHDGEEWSRCLMEAATYQMPAALRRLFAIILAFCNPQNPSANELFERHTLALCEDFLLSMPLSISQNRCLLDIQRYLKVHKKTLSDFGLPDAHSLPIVQRDCESYNPQEEREKAVVCYSTLNAEQLSVVHVILDACGIEWQGRRPQPPSSTLFYVDGPAGTGKTFVYNTIMHILRSQGKRVSAAAFTGIAASLLHGGRTLHSLFKLPVPLNERSTSTITPGDWMSTQLNQTDLFILDEAPMTEALALGAIDRLMRDISVDMPNKPFGGKVFLLGGDFRQCLPVVPRGGRSAIVSASIKRSKVWRYFLQLKLKFNMRADPAEKDFSDWLLNLGNGCLPSSHNFGDNSFEVPSCCMVSESLENHVFGEVITVDECHRLKSTAILTPCNDTSLRINDSVVAKIDGDAKTYISIDDVDCDSEYEKANFPTEFINSLTPSGMPPHRLILKVGAIIMLLRNLDVSEGLCNGTRLIVTRMHDHVIEAKFFDSSQQPVFIPRITCVPSDGDRSMPFRLKRQQFPVRLAFAMTINKSQGQTFDKIGISLPSPVFAHGQMYVAFSRVRRFEDVKVWIGPHPSQGVVEDSSWTQNIVYQDVL